MKAGRWAVPRAFLLGDGAPLQFVAFNHAGDLLASEDRDGTVCLWDPRSGRKLVEDVGHAAGHCSSVRTTSGWPAGSTVPRWASGK